MKGIAGLLIESSTGFSRDSIIKKLDTAKTPTKGDHDFQSERVLAPLSNASEQTSSYLSLLKHIQTDVATLKLPNNGNGTTDDQRRNIHDATEQYTRFIPRINQVTSSNFVQLLVEVLKETEEEVLLEDFHCLFYTPQSSGTLPIMSALDNFLYQCSTLEASLTGLALCRLIHDTFMDPISAATYFGVESRLADINTHEFHRVFLATKILLHCVKESEEPGQHQTSLLKMSIYNIYQTFYLVLTQKTYPKRDPASCPDGLMLGQSSIGKLVKTIFPNVETKRMGSRGASKYHFTGLIWKNLPTDSQTRQFLNIQLSQINMQKLRETSQSSSRISSISRPNPVQIAERVPHARSPLLDAPLFSYVNLSSKFPTIDFSPRVKIVTPRTVPQQSDWLRGLMSRSVNALKLYNVNLDHLILDFQEGMFSVELEQSLYSTVCHAEEKLEQNRSAEEAYLHLYLSILTLVLPSMLAFGEEIRPASKILLHASLRKLVKGIEERQIRRLPFEKDHRQIFKNNLLKLIQISETILVALPKELAADILQVIIDNLVDLQKEGDSLDDTNPLHDLCGKSIITMLNAHSYILPDDDTDKIEWIGRQIQCFGAMCIESKVDLQRILAETQLEHSTSNASLRFKILKLFIETFHKCASYRSLFSDLPIIVFRHVIRQVDMVIQTMNFQSFGKRDPTIATETFKIWWLINASFHDYIIILSEIVALGQLLDSMDASAY